MYAIILNQFLFSSSTILLFKIIFPSVGDIRPVKISIKVLLPEPDDPIIPIMSPTLISKSIFFKIFSLEFGYLKETFSNFMFSNLNLSSIFPNFDLSNY